MTEKKEPVELTLAKDNTKPETKVISKEEVNYFQQLKGQYNESSNQIASYELAKQNAVNNIFKLQEAEKNFVDQLYAKYELSRDMDISINIDNGEITMKPKKGPANIPAEQMKKPVQKEEK